MDDIIADTEVEEGGSRKLKSEVKSQVLDEDDGFEGFGEVSSISSIYTRMAEYIQKSKREAKKQVETAANRKKLQTPNSKPGSEKKGKSKVKKDQEKELAKSKVENEIQENSTRTDGSETCFPMHRQIESDSESKGINEKEPEKEGKLAEKWQDDLPTSENVHSSCSDGKSFIDVDRQCNDMKSVNHREDEVKCNRSENEGTTSNSDHAHTQEKYQSSTFRQCYVQLADISKNGKYRKTVRKHLKDIVKGDECGLTDTSRNEEGQPVAVESNTSFNTGSGQEMEVEHESKYMHEDCSMKNSEVSEDSEGYYCSDKTPEKHTSTSHDNFERNKVKDKKVVEEHTRDDLSKGDSEGQAKRSVDPADSFDSEVRKKIKIDEKSESLEMLPVDKSCENLEKVNEKSESVKKVDKNLENVDESSENVDNKSETCVKVDKKSELSEKIEIKIEICGEVDTQPDSSEKVDKNNESLHIGKEKDISEKRKVKEDANSELTKEVEVPVVAEEENGSGRDKGKRNREMEDRKQKKKQDKTVYDEEATKGYRGRRESLLDSDKYRRPKHENRLDRDWHEPEHDRRKRNPWLDDIEDWEGMKDISDNTSSGGSFKIPKKIESRYRKPREQEPASVLNRREDRTGANSGYGYKSRNNRRDDRRNRNDNERTYDNRRDRDFKNQREDRQELIGRNWPRNSNPSLLGQYSESSQRSPVWGYGPQTPPDDEGGIADRHHGWAPPQLPHRHPYASNPPLLHPPPPPLSHPQFSHSHPYPLLHPPPPPPLHRQGRGRHRDDGTGRHRDDGTGRLRDTDISLSSFMNELGRALSSEHGPEPSYGMRQKPPAESLGSDYNFPSDSTGSMARKIIASLMAQSGNLGRGSSESGLMKDRPCDYNMTRGPRTDFSINKGPPNDFSMTRSSPSDFSMNKHSPSDFSSSRNPQGDFNSNRNPPSDFSSSRNPPSDFNLSRNPQSDFNSNRNPPSDFNSNRNPPSDFTSNRNPQSDFNSNRNPQSDFNSNRNPQSDFNSSRNPHSDFNSCRDPNSDFHSNRNPHGNLSSSRDSHSDFKSARDRPSDFSSSGDRHEEYNSTRDPHCDLNLKRGPRIDFRKNMGPPRELNKGPPSELSMGRGHPSGVSMSGDPPSSLNMDKPSNDISLRKSPRTDFSLSNDPGDFNLTGEPRDFNLSKGRARDLSKDSISDFSLDKCPPSDMSESPDDSHLNKVSDDEINLIKNFGDSKKTKMHNNSSLSKDSKESSFTSESCTSDPPNDSSDTHLTKTSSDSELTKSSTEAADLPNEDDFEEPEDNEDLADIEDPKIDKHAARKHEMAFLMRVKDEDIAEDRGESYYNILSRKEKLKLYAKRKRFYLNAKKSFIEETGDKSKRKLKYMEYDKRKKEYRHLKFYLWKEDCRLKEESENRKKSRHEKRVKETVKMKEKGSRMIIQEVENPGKTKDMKGKHRRTVFKKQPYTADDAEAPYSPSSPICDEDPFPFISGKPDSVVAEEIIETLPGEKTPPLPYEKSIQLPVEKPAPLHDILLASLPVQAPASVPAAKPGVHLVKMPTPLLVDTPVPQPVEKTPDPPSVEKPAPLPVEKSIPHPVEILMPCPSLAVSSSPSPAPLPSPSPVTKNENPPLESHRDFEMSTNINLLDIPLPDTPYDCYRKKVEANKRNVDRNSKPPPTPPMTNASVGQTPSVYQSDASFLASFGINIDDMKMPQAKKVSSIPDKKDGKEDSVKDCEARSVEADQLEDAKNLNLSLADLPPYYQKTPLAQSLVDKCKDVPLLGLQYVMEVRQASDMTLDACYYLCVLCSKKMNAATLVAHVKSDPHRIHFCEIHCPEVYEKYGSFDMSNWTASLHRNLSRSLAQVETKMGHHRLAVAYEKDLFSVLASIKQNISDIKSRTNPVQQQSPVVPASTVDPTSRKLTEFRHDEERLKNDHSNLEVIFKKEPELHPLYQPEWKSFWRRRCQELEDMGCNPAEYDFKTEWTSFWHNHMQYLLDADFKAKRDSLVQKHGIKDPDLCEDVNTPVSSSSWSTGICGIQKAKSHAAQHSVVGCLKLLCEHEVQLGSFGPEVSSLLVKAIESSQSHTDPIKLFANSDNVDLIRFVCEKLSSQVSSGMLDAPAHVCTEKAIEGGRWLLSQVKKSVTKENFISSDIESIAKATLGKDTLELATYIAQYLLRVGKSDTSEEDLQRMLLAVKSAQAKMVEEQTAKPSQNINVGVKPSDPVLSRLCVPPPPLPPSVAQGAKLPSQNSLDGIKPPLPPDPPPSSGKTVAIKTSHSQKEELKGSGVSHQGHMSTKPSEEQNKNAGDSTSNTPTSNSSQCVSSRSVEIPLPPPPFMIPPPRIPSTSMPALNASASQESPSQMGLCDALFEMISSNRDIFFK